MKESSISQRLNELMQMYNLKQADVAKKTGLDKSTISYYLSGKREPAQDNIFTIAKAFDVDPAWLMGYDVPRHHIDNDYFHAHSAEVNHRMLTYANLLMQLTDEQQHQVLDYIDFIVSKSSTN